MGFFGNQNNGSSSSLKVLRKGPAMRVVFFYPGEEGSYVDHVEVTLYENGIVHIQSEHEDSTMDLKNCEILWNFQVETDERAPKVRLLKPKGGGGPTKSV